MFLAIKYSTDVLRLEKLCYFAECVSDKSYSDVLYLNNIIIIAINMIIVPKGWGLSSLLGMWVNMWFH